MLALFVDRALSAAGRLLDADRCDQPVPVFCGDLWGRLRRSGLKGLREMAARNSVKFGNSVGDKAAIVLWICAEATF